MTIGKFLSDLKEEYGGGNDKMMKVVELKKVEQRNRIIEEFVQKFRRVVGRSGYKESLSVEKFKKSMNRIIRQELMESECPLGILSSSMRG